MRLMPSQYISNERDRAYDCCGEALDNEIANGNIYIAVATAAAEPDPAEDRLIMIYLDSRVATWTGG